MPHLSIQPEGCDIRVVLLLASYSLHNFLEVTEAFLTQYAQEAKRNNYYPFSVKMRPRDSLKLYINFF